MIFIFSSTAMYLTIAFFIVLFIYGLYLAIRLYSHAEWQWFCLPFITVPPIFVCSVLEKRMVQASTINISSIIVIWNYVAFIIVCLLSGFAFYWLMNKYRQQTIFIHLYAFFYFFIAFAVAGYLTSTLWYNITRQLFFIDLIKLSQFYGIVILILGVGIMDYRWRRLATKDE